MKFLLAICFLFAAIGSQAKKPENISSPLDSPRYKEVLNKLITHHASDQVNDKERITNGEPAAEGQFPYQVYMYLSRPDGGMSICGGSVS